MAYWILLVLTAVVSTEARIFYNPILSDKSYEQPGAIKVNGTYYVTAKAPDISKGMFPVHTSTNLIDWKAQGYLLDEANMPSWALKSSLGAPSIHQVGLNFLLYFDGYNLTDYSFHIGVAKAPHPLGPYSYIDRLNVSMLSDETSFPSVINDGETLYLLWSTLDTIRARQLSTNGLSFSSDETMTLLTPSLSWEESNLFYPWYLRKGSYHYLFYTGGNSCEKSSIGVARSDHVLGPYEKLPDPILVSNSTYPCIGDATILKDLDDNNDVIFFCSQVSGPYAVFLASLLWDADDWPFMGEF